MRLQLKYGIFTQHADFHNSLFLCIKLNHEIM